MVLLLFVHTAGTQALKTSVTAEEAQRIERAAATVSQHRAHTVKVNDVAVHTQQFVVSCPDSVAVVVCVCVRFGRFFTFFLLSKHSVDW